MGLFDLLKRNKTSDLEDLGVANMQSNNPIEVLRDEPEVLRDEPEEDPEERALKNKLARTVVLPQIIPQVEILNAENKPKILAKPDEKICIFHFDCILLPQNSWVIDSLEDAEHSPFGYELFKDNAFTKIVIHESQIIFSFKEDPEDWQKFCLEMGQKLRELLQKELPLLNASTLQKLPSSAAVKKTAEELIESQINPGLAGHGGDCILSKIEGNTIFITMGGGCQGCSVAGDTLSFGIDKTLRENIPFLGAVIDLTDHSSGTNPFFQ
jgi:Fe-S cluster biogenesis protein NfuA